MVRLDSELESPASRVAGVPACSSADEHRPSGLLLNRLELLLS